MGFKKIDQSLPFADFALASSLKHNRSLKFAQLNISSRNLLEKLFTVPISLFESLQSDLPYHSSPQQFNWASGKAR